MTVHWLVFNCWKPLLSYSCLCLEYEFLSVLQIDPHCARDDNSIKLWLSVCWCEPFPRVEESGTQSWPSRPQGSWLVERWFNLVMCWHRLLLSQAGSHLYSHLDYCSIYFDLFNSSVSLTWHAERLAVHLLTSMFLPVTLIWCFVYLTD